MVGAGTGLAGFAEPSVALESGDRLEQAFAIPRVTPSFSKSLSVRSGRTSTSIELSRNTASYRPSPRLRSQSPTSMVASRTSPDHDGPGETASSRHWSRTAAGRGKRSFVIFTSIAHGTRRSEFVPRPHFPTSTSPIGLEAHRIDSRIAARLRTAVIARGLRRGAGLQRHGRGRRGTQDRRWPRRRGSARQ